MCSHVYNNQELEFSFSYSQTNALPLIYLPYLNTTYKHKTKSGLPFLQLPNGRYYITLAKDIGQLAPHDETNKYYFQIEKKNKGINFIEVNAFSYEYLFALPREEITFSLKQTETQLIGSVPWPYVSPRTEPSDLIRTPGHYNIPPDTIHTNVNYLCEQDILKTKFLKVKKPLSLITQDSNSEYFIGENSLDITYYSDQKVKTYHENEGLPNERSYNFFYDNNSKILVDTGLARQNIGNGYENRFNVFFSPSDGFYGRTYFYQVSGNYYIDGNENGTYSADGNKMAYILLNNTYTLSNLNVSEQTTVEAHIWADENFEEGIYFSLFNPYERLHNDEYQFGYSLYTTIRSVGSNHTGGNPILDALNQYEVQEFTLNQIDRYKDLHLIAPVPTQVFKYTESLISNDTQFTQCLKEAVDNSMEKVPSLFPGNYEEKAASSWVGRILFDRYHMHFPDESDSDNPPKYKDIERLKGLLFQYSLLANFATFTERYVLDQGNMSLQETMTNYREIEIPYIQTVTFPEEYDISLSNIKIGQNAAVNNGTYKHILYVEKNFSREYDMSDIPVKS